MNFTRIIACALLVSCAFSFSNARADAPAANEAAKPEISSVYLRVRNLRPGILGYWLDPVNNRKPISPLEVSKHVQKLGSSFDISPPDPYAIPLQPQNKSHLPSGVEKVIAINPQNALLARGTKEGLERLKLIVEKLDQPRQFVMMDAVILDVSADDLKDFDIDFKPLPAPAVINPELAPKPEMENAEFSAGVVRSDFRAALTALLRDKRVKVLAAPSTMTLNGLSIRMVYSDLFAMVGLTDTLTGIGSVAGTASDLVFIHPQIPIEVVPIVDPNGVIRLTIETKLEWKNSPLLNKMAPFSQPSPVVAHLSDNPNLFTQAAMASRATVMAYMHDNQTLALRGFRTTTVTVGEGHIAVLDPFPLQNRSLSHSEEREIIIFLTAHLAG